MRNITRRNSNPISNAIKQKNPKNKKVKSVLTFDEHAREDYLTGFSKRKAERKRVAHENIIEDLKDEKKRIKLQKRQELNEKWEKLNLKLEFEHIVKPTVYDLQEHTVTVTDVSEVDFASCAAFKIGTNQASTEDSDEEEKPSARKTNPAADDSDQTDKESSDDETEKAEKKKKRDAKIKKRKGRKNLTHLMSKQNQAKKRRKRKMESKLPSNMRERGSKKKVKSKNSKKSKK